MHKTHHIPVAASVHPFVPQNAWSYRNRFFNKCKGRDGLDGGRIIEKQDTAQTAGARSTIGPAQSDSV